MTKGKYAAKAKNRLANLDNEILQDVIAQRDALKVERDNLSAQLEGASRDLVAKAMRKAEELSRQEVARLEAELRKERADRATEREQTCFELFRLFVETNARVNDGNYDSFAELFGMGDRIGELVISPTIGDAPRRVRRLTTSKVRKIDSETTQAKSTVFMRLNRE